MKVKGTYVSIYDTFRCEGHVIRSACEIDGETGEFTIEIASDEDTDGADILDCEYVEICGGDFKFQAKNKTTNSDYEKMIKKLKSLGFAKVDYLTIDL
jgi:hypothetical protein